jgi:putative transposase
VPLPGLRVTRVLERLRAAIGLPQSIVLDYKPEFAGRTLEAWAYAAHVTLCFIRPGKPIENAYIARASTASFATNASTSTGL